MPIDRIGTDGIENGAVVPADLSTGGPSWDSSGNLSFNSGFGSTAVAYGCRAWVNFNGTGTVAIRASGNVSSITDNGTGDYTVNFTTAMPDANYSGVVSVGNTSYASPNIGEGASPTTTAFRFVNRNQQSGSAFDLQFQMVAIFR